MRLTVLLIALFAFFNLNAQEVTDYDLRNFVMSYYHTMNLNADAQKQMVDTIEKEGLSLEAYHAINESKDTDLIPELPDEDFDKYEKIYPKILVIQENLEAEIDKVYEHNDLNRQEYKAIAERVKEDYLLQAKAEKLLADLRAFAQ